MQNHLTHHALRGRKRRAAPSASTPFIRQPQNKPLFSQEELRLLVAEMID